jgi:hypothetical protein
MAAGRCVTLEALVSVAPQARGLAAAQGIRTRLKKGSFE